MTVTVPVVVDVTVSVMVTVVVVGLAVVVTVVVNVTVVVTVTVPSDNVIKGMVIHVSSGRGIPKNMNFIKSMNPLVPEQNQV